jgi:hypothetical protein
VSTNPGIKIVFPRTGSSRCRVLLDNDNFLARNIKLSLPRQFDNEKTLQDWKQGAEQLSHAPLDIAQILGCIEKDKLISLTEKLSNKSERKFFLLIEKKSILYNKIF